METNLRRPTWVSVLQPQPEWTAKTSPEAPHVRVLAQVDADEIGLDNERAQTDLVETSPARRIKRYASPGECQREFNEARKANPDALYDDLCEVAAKRLGVPLRVVKKHVPTPFR